jgi:CheY-like chemotaxis protein
MTQSLGDKTALHGTVPGLRADEARPAHDASSYVLVVDDEELVRDFIGRCLEDRGYAVKKADSAAEALELMVNKPASVVLSDIKMPGQDGLWLADRLRAHWPNTPVIMVTGIDDLDTVRLSREVGAVDYVTKPIAREQLLQVVRRAAAPPSAATSTPEVSVPAPVPLPTELPTLHGTKVEAEYTLESPVRCPACGERITTLRAVRLVRAQVNFTSTLPRRGRVLACPHCLAVVPAELSNF